MNDHEGQQLADGNSESPNSPASTGDVQPSSETVNIPKTEWESIQKTIKRLDDEMKRAATELGAAARRRDGQGAIDAFQWLQSNCYGCHREFRGDFVRHFYGAP